MGTTDTPSKGNSPSQSGQGQTKPQQNPSSGQPSSGQQKPRDGSPSTDKAPSRSAQSGDDTIGAIGRGEDAMGDDESDPESNISGAGSDRGRSNGDRTQVR